MAGTRVLVVASFLIPFIIWVAICGWAGLKDDLLWSKIFGHPAILKPLPEKIVIDPITIYVEESQLNYWETQIRKSRFTVETVKDTAEHRSLCDREQQQRQTSKQIPKGIVVCEPDNTKQNPEVFVVNHHLGLFYPTIKPNRSREFRDLFHSDWLQHGSLDSPKIQVGLWMGALTTKEHRLNAMHSLTQWMERHSGLENSCFSGFELKVEERIEFGLAKNVIPQQTLAKRFSSERETHLVLYLSQANETLLSGEISTLVGNNYFHIVQDTSSIPEAVQKGTEALVVSTCWGIGDAVVLDGHNDGDIFLFMEEMFHVHRRFFSEAPSIIKQAEHAATLLSTSKKPSRLSILRFYDMVSSLGITKDSDPSSALSGLITARQLSNEIQQDTSLVLTADFPLDQYAAIFAPLLFPLILPTLLTFVREWKQYRSKSLG